MPNQQVLLSRSLGASVSEVEESFGRFEGGGLGLAAAAASRLWFDSNCTKRKESWVCDLCNKLFASRYYYERHMKCHLSQKEECPFCPFRSTYKWNLKSHIRKKHFNQQSA